jgi:hypothetical protein
MHQCLTLLKNREKLVFLSFTNVDPHSLTRPLHARRRNQNLRWNEMHRFQRLMTKNQQGGVARQGS